MSFDIACLAEGWGPVVLGVTLALAAGAVVNALLVRRRGARLLQAERDRLDQFFEASPSGLVVFDASHTVLRINSAAVALAGGPSGARSGLSHGQLLGCANLSADARGCGFGEGCWFCPLRKVIDQVFVEGGSVRGLEAPMTLLRAGAVQTVWIRMSAQPFEFGGVRHLIVALDDVTENRRNLERVERASAELARANEAIREETRAKERFLANMSHEIRTPLNGIIGMNALLLGTCLDAEQKEYGESIATCAAALLKVVNDILDFSRIEADKLVLEQALFNVQLCLEEAVRVVAPQAARKGLELAWLAEEALAPVWVGDSGRVRQVLVNLLGNAIKFTERGEVVVSVGGRPEEGGGFRLEFTIRDTGVGIPPESQGRLFQSFCQLGDTAGSQSQGTGLGLAICKGLCERMGGGITLESKGISGQGCVVRFWVRVAAVALTRPLGGGSEGTLAGRRVLLVEDHAASLESLVRLARGWGMEPVAASTGAAALAALRSGGVADVAVIDDGLPDLTGGELIRALRALPGCAALRSVLLLPYGVRAARDAEAPPCACLSKPVGKANLLEALAGVLAGRDKSCAEAAAGAGTGAYAGARPAALLAETRPLRILVAEDNAINQKVVVGQLARLGYAARVVGDGAQALDALAECPYDVVLMDVQMPGTDGEQATAQIRRSLPPERQPWIVAMTANALKGDRERYLGTGMDDYLSKPFSADGLAEVLRAARPLAARAGCRVGGV